MQPRNLRCSQTLNGKLSGCVMRAEIDLACGFHFPTVERVRGSYMHEQLQAQPDWRVMKFGDASRG